MYLLNELILIFIIKYWHSCAYLKVCLNMVFTLVTNSGRKINILITPMLVRQLFPTNDNKYYISTSLVSCIILSEFVNVFCMLFHACSGIDSKIFCWTNGRSHLLIFWCDGEPLIWTKKDVVRLNRKQEIITDFSNHCRIRSRWAVLQSVLNLILSQ